MVNNCLVTKFKGAVSNPDLPIFVNNVFNPATARRGYAVMEMPPKFYVAENATHVVSAPIPIPEGATKVLYSNIQTIDTVRFVVSTTIDDTVRSEMGGQLNTSGTGEITLTTEMITNGKYITLSVYRGSDANTVDLSNVTIGFVF
jgi:hypothetical protein